MNSITKKWLRGSLLTTLLVLLLAEGLFLFQSYNLYYGGVRQAVPAPKPGTAPHGGAVRREGQV